jgi:hypothetical protein
MSARKVANPGSALGEAIGASMENSLRNTLSELADSYGCHYLTSGLRKTKGGNKAKKLLLFDIYGTKYDLDGVIANEAMQPLILIESKYIRYKKHNRDKGSWVCHAHAAVRRRYQSVRSCIAILAGSWSKTSVAMMRSHDINIFLIPFDYVCQLLAEFGVDFNWGEKDREKAYSAWEKYNHMKEEQKAYVGDKMAGLIRNDLIAIIESTLDESITREIEVSNVTVELRSNLGEVKVLEFDTLEEATIFLEKDLDSIFITWASLSLFDPPPQFDDTNDIQEEEN